MSEKYNINRKCAELGLAVVDSGCDYKTMRILLTKVLGILRENSIYSFLVWLEERGAGKDLSNERLYARRIYQQCLNILWTEELIFLRKKIQFKSPDEENKFKKYLDCTSDVKDLNNWREIVGMMNQVYVLEATFSTDELFFIVGIYEQMLTYSLYKAKAGEKNA